MYMLALLMIIHGFIHFMGFAKAFHYADMKQLTIPVSKPLGMVWLLTGVLFACTAVLFILRKEHWWVLAFSTIILSQIVIITSWKDAKFGTIANLLILIGAMLIWGNSRFENTYRKDVKQCLAKGIADPVEILVERDIQHLPQPVQRYMKYAGVINKPKVNNVKIIFEGQMRDKGKDYFTFTSEQYNFFDEPARLFFMKGEMFGITVPGYHRYKNAMATMDIRLFGLFSIVQKKGVEMNKAETVTLFNDMCLLAPATLIDKRIQWQPIDSNTASAVFTNRNISIAATLSFNTRGQLISFISNDRLSVSDMKTYPWFTPIHSYKTINDLNVMSEGDAVWRFDDGDFVYGKFKLKEISYNVTQ
jgi:hypothetical protein